MGLHTSDSTGLYECMNHPGVLSPRRLCVSAERDGIPDQYCTCCDKCREICFVTPHGHGDTPENEWEGTICKICGEDVSVWIK